MRAVVWITERSWEACVDEAAALMPDEAEVTLLVAPSGEAEEVAAGGRAGLFGRRPPPEPQLREISDEAAQALLDDARERLGRDARTVVRRGRVEREVVAECEGAGLLVMARDGERKLGPPSLGRHGRFVVDHAPCRVLLVWAATPPGVATIPPPPRHPPGEGPPPPPHGGGPPPPPPHEGGR
jgi:nucleotide-binding universal stress UspA family protein